MKVLKNNYHTEEVILESARKLTCEYCGSELEYEMSDMRIGSFGLVYVDCPCCGKDNTLYEEDGITLTADNLEFPTHFWHTSKKTGAVDCCNNEVVKEYIRNGINYFRKNKNEFVWYCGSGNLFVTVYRYEGDENYYAQVTNNYYDTYIPFESKDY